MRAHKIYCKFLILFFLCYMQNVVADDAPQTLPEVQTTKTLSPKMRSQSLDSSKYVFQSSDLQPYLENIIIFDSYDAYDAQPRILGFASDSAFGTTGDLAYVTGLAEADNISAYTILKQGQEYKSPEDGEYLGMQALIIGSADVVNYGDPQTVRITKMADHIEIGARLIQRTGLDLPAVIDAKPAAAGIKGFIISVKNPRSGVGKYSTLIVSLGSRDGLKFGDLLELKDKPKTLYDKVREKKSVVDSVSFGEVLIYKVMDKVSLGFIVSTSRPVLVGDEVASGQ